ncbi:MAG: HAD-IIB family hydrolase [Pseudomonadota bacterium]
MPTPIASLLVFTDLDGTLLDHHDYGFEQALPAIQRLKHHDVPIIFNTSKTLAESIALAEQLGICQPLIVENGAAIALPKDYDFRTRRPSGRAWQEAPTIVSLGTPIIEIRAVLEKAEKALALGERVQTFSSLSVNEIQALTGLPNDKAVMAKDRLFSEPFRWLGDGDMLQLLEQYLDKNALQLTRGGRFHHVTGPHNKRTAMVRMTEMFNTSADLTRSCLVIALGDSQNDAEMLAGADIAVVVSNPAGSGITINHPDVRYTKAEGPLGWREGIDEILADVG